MPFLAAPLSLNKNRGHNFNGEMICTSKKLHSSNATTRESGNAIANNAAVAATSSPNMQELAGNRDNDNGICKKGHHLPGGALVWPWMRRHKKSSGRSPPLYVAWVVCTKTGRLLHWTLHCRLRVSRNLWGVITTTMARMHVC
ncbi:hypothetical protein C2845_PM05G08750 [Panicum miliaceum]|uniref:Uncharacterized protein n=1 Tax=Panicum miliaceum TaxID=4540 RepID=A0A3L6SYS2_PANMI|nr:hypothetical protein C2845_PM05G08750 [Panicum miliaceum]